MRDQNGSFHHFSVLSRVLRAFPAIIQAAPLITLRESCQKVSFGHFWSLLVTFGQNLRVGRPELDAQISAFLQKSTSESIGKYGAFRSRFLIRKSV